ncbi:hypothetical protein HYW74_02785 [Candidatus Pacearchaeota archaeon]|nr:hypothetical protein [Candidatus Pacearchaeota archaeon]
MAINWLIVIVAIIAIFTLVKVKYFRHKAGWIIIIVVALLLYFGYAFAVSGKDIDYKSIDGMQTAVKLYVGWLGHAFDNAKTITANVVKMDWKGNQTIEDVNKEAQKPQAKQVKKIK